MRITMGKAGIRSRLILGMAVILIGLGGAGALTSVLQLDHLLRVQLKERVEAQALNWIAENYVQIVVTRDPLTLDRLVGELRSRSSTAYVSLAGPDGRERAAEGVPDGVPRNVDPAKEPSWDEMRDSRGLAYLELTLGISATGTEMNRDLQSMFRVAGQARPGEQGDKPENSGWLRVGVDERDIEATLAGFLRSTVLVGLVLVGLAVVVTFLFANRIVKPITEIGKAANQIADGDLSLRVERGVELRDEVGELVRNFNRMASQLERSCHEMNLLTAGLEEKVYERTLELEAANRKLEERDRVKSDFISTVSHELRTPLTSIKAHAEILMDSEDPAREEVTHRLAIIDESTDRLTRLIEDMLDLRKIESGAVLWKTTETDLRKLVAEAAELLAPKASEKGVRLVMGEMASLRAMVDPDQIQRVLTNLIGNAIKFCAAGDTVELTLALAGSSGPRRCETGDWAEVRVRDSGPGIPSEELDRIFEPFHQAKRASCAVQGTGLGLTISREIVLHHEGEIWVESVLGEGSSFSFTLPLETERRAALLRAVAAPN